MSYASNPFLYFNSSPDIIRLVVTMYVRFPLSLHSVEDRLFERGIDICHEPQASAARPCGIGGTGSRRCSRVRSYPATMRQLGDLNCREAGQWLNNRAENSHLPFRRRERAMQWFRRMKSLQKFASVHASFHDHFDLECHLVDRQTFKLRRSTALAEWQLLVT